MAGISDLEGANRFLNERYIAEFNEHFTVPAAEKGTAFRRTARADLDWVFTLQTERVVSKDNTVAIADRSWQLEKSRFRSSLAGCTVTIHEHLNGDVSIRYGPHVVARNTAEAVNPVPRSTRAKARKPWKGRARGSRGKPQTGFPPLPPALGNPAEPAGFPLSHRCDHSSCYEQEKTTQTAFGEPKGNGGANQLNRTDHV